MTWVQLAYGGQDGQGPEGFLNRFPALRIFEPESYSRRGLDLAAKRALRGLKGLKSSFQVALK